MSRNHNMSPVRCQHRKKEADCQEDNVSVWMDGDGSSCAEKFADKDPNSAQEGQACDIKVLCMNGKVKRQAGDKVLQTFLLSLVD